MVILDVIQEKLDLVLFIIRDLVLFEDIKTLLQAIDILFKGECSLFMAIE
jgi:hypothetical protein